MDKLVYLVYPVLLLILLWGSKVYGRKKWNEECFSIGQMKAVQGFAALCIILHHIGQKTCAGWLPRNQIIPGLEMFVPSGYLLVGIFLFCSGFGLYKSYHTKENYLNGFCRRRILPLVVTAYLVNTLYFIARLIMGEKMSVGTAIRYLTGLRLCNTNGWFVYAMPILYLGFYLSFRFCKNKRNALLLTIGVVFGYIWIGTAINHNNILFCGEWWYNSVSAFVVGLLFARFEKPLTEHIKRFYVLYLILSVVLFMPLFTMGEMAQGIFSYYGENFGANHIILRRWICLFAQMLISFDFLCIVWLLGMKLRIGNRLLAFVGSITLELYLVHGLFVELFSRSFLGFLKPIFFCRNVALYILIVTLPSIPLAMLLKWGVDKICKRTKGYKDDRDE